MKNSLLIIFAAIIAGSAGFYFHRSSIAPNSEIVFAGKLLDTQLPDLSDQPQQLKKWQGKILIINFWATWCPPCLSEIPEFIDIQALYADKNVQFVGIAVDEKQAVLDYNALTKINYPVLIAGDAGIEISKAWGNAISSVPFTVIVNPQGQIIHRQLGELSQKQLLNLIQPLINVASAHSL